MNKSGAFIFVASLLIIFGCQSSQPQELPAQPRSPQSAGSTLGFATGIFPGYGPAYSVFEQDSLGNPMPLFALSEEMDIDRKYISGDVNSDYLDVPVYAALSGGYIWGTGYYYNGPARRWEPYQLTGEFAANSNFIKNKASAKLSIHKDNLFSKGKNFVLAYACKKYPAAGSGFKCGCSATDDAVCNKWMLQYFYLDETPPSPDEPGDLPSVVIEDNIGPYLFVESESSVDGDEWNFDGLFVSANVAEYSYKSKKDGPRAAALVIVYQQGTSPEFLWLKMKGLVERELRGGAQILENFNGHRIITIYREHDFMISYWVSDNKIILTLFATENPEPRPYDLNSAYLELYPSSVPMTDDRACGDDICSGYEAVGQKIRPYCPACEETESGEVCPICEDSYAQAFCTNDCNYGGYCGDGRCSGPEVSEDKTCVAGESCILCPDDCVVEQCDITSTLTVGGGQETFVINGVEYSLVLFEIRREDGTVVAELGINGEVGSLTLKHSERVFDGSLSLYLKEAEAGADRATVCINKELSLSCGQGIATDSKAEKVNFGSINTIWSQSRKGAGWLYGGVYRNSDEPVIGYALQDGAYINCEEVKLLNYNPENKGNALLVEDGQPVCIKQEGHYGLFIPLRQTSASFDKEGEYGQVEYTWYYNNNKEKGVFDLTSCYPSYGAVCGDGVCEKEEDRQICALATKECPPEDPNCNVCKRACPNDCTGEQVCTDSDGGLNYQVRGTINPPANGITEDFCYREDSGWQAECKDESCWAYNMLHENYCDGKYPTYEKYVECKNGCDDGACRPVVEEPTPCDDDVCRPVEEDPSEIDISVSALDSNEPYEYFFTVCVNGPKSINDLETEISGLNGLPWSYTIMLDEVAYGMTFDAGGAIEDLKDGSCNNVGFEIQDSDRAVFDQAKNIKVTLDPGNLIIESDESNNAIDIAEANAIAQ